MPLESLKSTWNYRVVKTLEEHLDGTTEEIFSVHECHYEPLGWTVNPVPVTGASIHELRWQLNKMLVALDIEVLDDTASKLCVTCNEPIIDDLAHDHD